VVVTITVHFPGADNLDLREGDHDVV
jgi:hypothetical protein